MSDFERATERVIGGLPKCLDGADGQGGRIDIDNWDSEAMVTHVNDGCLNHINDSTKPTIMVTRVGNI